MKIYHTINPDLSVRLNIARAGAAFLVAISHIRGAFFLDWNHLSANSQNVLNYILFFFTRLGHEAVIIFFVLSGYLVGGSLLSDYILEKANWRKYFVNRVARMWVVLIPALMIGAICDYYTIQLNPHNPGAEHFIVNAFIGNIFFLQTIIVPTFGTNGPLWSLANEFWYYMIWPLFFIILKLNYKTFIKISLIIISLSIISYLIPGIMKLFPIWIAGALIRVLNLNIYFKNKISLIISYLFGIIGLSYANIYPSLLNDYILGLTIVWIILHWQNGIYLFRKMNVKIPQFFSEFSFSLYATHYFLMFLVLEVARHFFNLGKRLPIANFLNWMILIFITLIILSLSWVFYYFTERHTITIRKIVYSKINNAN